MNYDISPVLGVLEQFERRLCPRLYLHQVVSIFQRSFQTFIIADVTGWIPGCSSGLSNRLTLGNLTFENSNVFSHLLLHALLVRMRFINIISSRHVAGKCFGIASHTSIDGCTEQGTGGKGPGLKLGYRVSDCPSERSMEVQENSSAHAKVSARVS